MLTATNIYVQYGERILFDRVNLVIGLKEKVGLVGRNGAGKSTFLKIIAGFQSPDEGNVVRPTDSSLGFLHQDMILPQGKTVMEETMTAFQEVKALEIRINEINEEIANRTDYESEAYANLLNDFSDLNERFVLLGGESSEGDAQRVLKGLGFKQSDYSRLTTEFSGGWQMRIELAKMLLQKPDFLLLDEPTNHLDIESILWLESFLENYQGAVIVISHDKQFLDNITKRTVEIELGKVHDYKAPYLKYLELRADRRAKQLAAYSNQQKMIAQKERTINRFMAKATKTKMAQSMQKQLDKVERLEIESEDVASMGIQFPPAPRSGQVVIEGKKIVKKYDDHTVLNGVDIKLDRGDRVSFVGQNGQGKTTLAKILIQKIEQSNGDVTLGHNVSIGYYAQNQADSLHPNLTLLETMENASPPEMRTKLRSILGAFLFSGEDVDKKVSVLSGGERARLALACMLLRPFNLLVLDEPTNHLDIISKDVLKQALIEYDGTLIVVSHDRDFLGGLTNRTIEFRDQQLHDYLGDINYFLEKRQLENMRAVERSQKQKSESKKAQATLSYEERKKLMRSLNNVEKQIEKLESEIETFEAQMADPAFYNQPDVDLQTKLYESKKTALNQAMMDWEKIQEEAEMYGIA